MILISISCWKDKMAPSRLPKQATFLLCFQGCPDTFYTLTLFPVTLCTFRISVAQKPNTVPPLSLSCSIHSPPYYPNRISTVLSVQFWTIIPSYQENYLFLKSYYNFKKSLALSICLSSFPTCSLRLRACLLKMFIFNLFHGLIFLGL